MGFGFVRADVRRGPFSAQPSRTFGIDSGCSWWSWLSRWKSKTQLWRPHFSPLQRSCFSLLQLQLKRKTEPNWSWSPELTLTRDWGALTSWISSHSRCRHFEDAKSQVRTGFPRKKLATVWDGENSNALNVSEVTASPSVMSCVLLRSTEAQWIWPADLALRLSL